MINQVNDYAEFCVEGESQKIHLGVRFLLVVLLLFGFLLLIMMNSAFFVPHKLSMLGSILEVVYLFFSVYIISNTNQSKQVEYDYTFIENDLDIDAVYHKSKRNHLVTVHMDHAKCIAPEGSSRLLGYEGKGPVKVRDFSGFNTEIPYAIIVEKNNQIVKLLIEPQEHMLALMKARNKDIFYEE